MSVQEDIFKKLGKEKYLKLPKEGTNPRGVEVSKETVNLLITHPKTLKIKIKWDKGDLEHMRFNEVGRPRKNFPRETELEIFSELADNLDGETCKVS